MTDMSTPNRHSAPVVLSRTGDLTVRAPPSHTNNSTAAMVMAASNSPPPPLVLSGSSLSAIPPDKPSVLQLLRHRPTITILLIGETGTGKTSFMSLLVNLFKGKGAFELEDVHDESKESGLIKTQSQTTSATMYTITTSQDLKIRILDTPGLADTGGLEVDRRHKEEINTAIKECIETIDAVLILANGSVQRLGAATAYTLNTLALMFPHSIVENIGFIFTNSDPETLNFETEGLPEELRGCPFWVIQNPLALLNRYKKNSTRGALPDSSKMDRKISACYDETVETLNEWMKWLSERPLKPTHEINELYEKSVDIESRLQEVLSCISRLAEERLAWENIASGLMNVKRRKSLIEALMKQQPEPVWTHQDSEDYNTICFATNCYKNCHVPCEQHYYLPGPLLGFFCQAFSFRVFGATTCKVCNHTVDQHGRYKYIHVQKPVELDEKTKLEWANAQTEEEKLAAAQNAARRGLESIETTKTETLTQLRHLIDDYNSIALCKNFGRHIRSALQVLEYRKKELQSKKGTEKEILAIDEGVGRLKEQLGVIEGSAGGIHRAVGRVKDVARVIANVPGSMRHIGPNR